MNLSIYNTLSNLISGSLVYIACFYILDLQVEYLDSLIVVAIAYIIGYFLNTISVWTEFMLYYTWGGKPSNQLLEGKKCRRINFVEHQKIKKLIQNELKTNKAGNDALFQFAIRKTCNEGRIPEMNAEYAFARSIFTAILVSIAIIIPSFYQYWLFWVIHKSVTKNDLVSVVKMARHNSISQ